MQNNVIWIGVKKVALLAESVVRSDNVQQALGVMNRRCMLEQWVIEESLQEADR